MPILGIGVDQVAEILGTLESRAITFSAKRCAKMHHRQSHCTRCIDACPSQAIAWEESLQVDKTKCTSCGLCATVCPTGAFESAKPTNAELVDQLKGKSQVVFACSKAGNSTDARVVRVGCLGRLDESILVGAVSYGVQEIELTDGACAGCPGAIGRTIAEQSVAQATAVLSALSLNPHIAFCAELPAPAPKTISNAPDAVSRRAFFNLFARETAGVVAATVGSIMAQDKAEAEGPVRPVAGEMPTYLPAKRQLLLDAVRRLARPGGDQGHVHNGPWVAFAPKPACNVCQICAFFCPTGALTKTLTEGEPGLALRVARCTDCRLCVDICFRQAVELVPDVDLTQVAEETTQAFHFAKEQYALTFASPEDKIKNLISGSPG